MTDTKLSVVSFPEPRFRPVTINCWYCGKPVLRLTRTEATADEHIAIRVRCKCGFSTLYSSQQQRDGQW